MPQHVAELCSLLVQEIYGELSSRVFSVLIRLGRLSLRSIAQRLRLTDNQLKRGLAVLVQQHLVFHHTSSDDDVTYYEANWLAAYFLIRSGKIITLVESGHGAPAGEIVNNLLLQGHATVEDLLHAYSITSSANQIRTRDAVPDEQSPVELDTPASESGAGRTETQLKPNSIATNAEVREKLDVLHKRGLISSVRAHQFHSSADNYNDAVKVIKAKGEIGGSKGSLADARFQLAVREELRHARDEDLEEPGSWQIIRPLKRSAEEDGGPTSRAKKRKLAPSPAETGRPQARSVESQGRLPLSEKLAIRVDLEKYIVLARNQWLAEVAEQSTNSSTAYVYAELLGQLTINTPRCHDDLEDPVNPTESLDDGPTVSTIDVALKLSSDIDLTWLRGNLGTRQGGSVLQNGTRKRIGPNDLLVAGSGDGTGDGRGTKINGRLAEAGEGANDADRDELDDETVDSVSFGAADGRTLEIRDHFRILAQTPHCFVRQVNGRRHGEWTVDFRRLVNRHKQAELENIILMKFGDIALRLVRILSEKGKLDERQISNLALIRPKDSRATLSMMHEAGFLELQEVPRDVAHQPTRTIYLWFFDADRCAQMVLENIYKMMARLLQRNMSERQDIRPLLDKAERTDVVGQEERYLTLQERKSLQAWRDKEEKLLGQIMRLDRQVELLRDY